MIFHALTLWTSISLLIASVVPTSHPIMCDVVADAGPDTSICVPGGIVQLQGSYTGQGVAWEWSPLDGLSDPLSLTPTADVTSDITYELTVYGVNPGAPNLVTNGNFELGNGFFTSDYNFVADDPLSQVEMWTEGTYTVIDNPNLVHSNFASCDDHTGGGNMLVLNGAPDFQDIWCQNITVNPDTYYNFEAWVASVTSASPAQLQFSINGMNIGEIFNGSSTTCFWQSFNAVWNSGSITSAEICILNLNTQPSGNDFVIDDIAFYELCPDTDEVTISLIDEPAPLPEIIGPDVICAGQDYTFSVNLPDSPMVESIQWTVTNLGMITGGSDDESVTAGWNFPGTAEICVEIQTRCSDNQNCFTVQIDEIPETPVIAGPIEVCSGETVIYNVVPDPFTESIFWTVSSSGVLLSDPQADEIEVQWDGSGIGDVCVAFSNHCGTSETCLPTDIYTATTEVLDTTVCDGITFMINGTLYGAGNWAGTEIMMSQYGCDSIIEVVVTEVDVLTSMNEESLCTGDSALIHGQYQMAAGLYTDTFPSFSGCDSIASVELILVDADTHYVNTITCNASEAGTTTSTYPGANCDSVVIESVVWIASDSTFISLSSCNPSDTGMQIVTLTNMGGCDSTVITEVQYSSFDSISIIQYSCSPLDTGTVVTNLVNQFGCDSIVTTTTIYAGSETTFIDISSCDPQDAGTETIVMFNVFGCDSNIVITTELLPSDTLWSDSFTCNPSEAGETTYHYTNVHGCDSVVIDAVMLLPPSFCEIEIHTELITGCPGEPTLLVVSSEVGLLPIYFELLNTNTGQKSNHTANAHGVADTILINDSGNYRLSAISSANVAYNQIFDITIPDPFEVEIFQDEYPSGHNVACHGDTSGFVSVLVMGGTPPYAYHWSTGDTSDELSGLPAGVYSITITDAAGCTAGQIIDVLEPPPLISEVESTHVDCFGNSNGTIHILLFGGTPNYNVYLDGMSLTSDLVEALPAGTYHTEAIDMNGCVARDTAYIEEPDPLEVEIGRDTTLQLGQSISISVAANHELSNITWHPFPCDNCESIDITPGSSTGVQVSVTDVNGCTAVSNLFIDVQVDRDLFVPNVFSPNGDGVNDRFFISAQDPSTEVESLEIFDRWGNLVFAAQRTGVNRESEGWDGSFNGQETPAAVYVYSGVIVYPDGVSKTIKGDVTLIR